MRYLLIAIDPVVAPELEERITAEVKRAGGLKDVGGKWSDNPKLFTSAAEYVRNVPASAFLIPVHVKGD